MIFVCVKCVWKMKECSVCCEKYNKTTRKCVNCAHCNYDACRGCHKTYILQTIQDPHCMSCKVPWDNDVIIDNFTKNFFQTELRKHREKVMFEREKALMPASQQELRQENLRKEMDLLLQLADLYSKTSKEARYLKEAQAIADELGEPLRGVQPVVASKAEKSRAVAGCIDEKCKGFIMSNNWCCGLCDMQVCKHCLKAKQEDHVCKEEDKDTRKLLLNNTKPCPKCAVMISKVDGCNQMWCVMCHTTFEWTTGEIVKTNIHNPHYYEWLRRTGQQVPRAPEDVPRGVQGGVANLGCENRLPHAYAYQGLIRGKYSFAEIQALLGLHRLALHIQEVEIRGLQANLVELNNNELRKQYLNNKLTEEGFKREIYNRHLKRERSQSFINVMQLFHNHLHGLLVAFGSGTPSFTKHIAELQELTNYCNECFIGIGRVYNVRPYTIIVAPYPQIKRGAPKVTENH